MDTLLEQATPRGKRTPCMECGWLCPPREYHPIVACWIVKQTGRDPMPYLRSIAQDMAHVDEQGTYHSILERLETSLSGQSR